MINRTLRPAIVWGIVFGADGRPRVIAVESTIAAAFVVVVVGAVLSGRRMDRGRSRAIEIAAGVNLH